MTAHAPWPGGFPEPVSVTIPRSGHVFMHRDQNAVAEVREFLSSVARRGHYGATGNGFFQLSRAVARKTATPGDAAQIEIRESAIA